MGRDSLAADVVVWGSQSAFLAGLPVGLKHVSQVGPPGSKVAATAAPDLRVLGLVALLASDLEYECRFNVDAKVMFNEFSDPGWTGETCSHN